MNSQGSRILLTDCGKSQISLIHQKVRNERQRWSILNPPVQIKGWEPEPGQNNDLSSLENCKKNLY